MLKFYNKDGFFVTSDEISSFNIFREDVETIKKYLEENNIPYQYHADALGAFAQQEARFQIKRIIDNSDGDKALPEEKYIEIELDIIDEILNKSESILDSQYLEDIATEMYEMREKEYQEKE